MLNVNFYKPFRGSSLLFLGLLLSFTSFFLSGCLKNDDINLEEEHRKQQEAYLKQLATDTMAIKQHLQEKGITNAKRTASGLFYVEEQVGAGKKPVSHKEVTTQYVLRTLQGETLDAGSFSFDLGTGQAVPGFDEGVALMRVGGKSKLFLPSGLAYGPKGSYPKIAPNTILTFDVELLKAEQ